MIAKELKNDKIILEMDSLEYSVLLETVAVLSDASSIFNLKRLNTDVMDALKHAEKHVIEDSAGTMAEFNSLIVDLLYNNSTLTELYEVLKPLKI